MVSMGLSRSIQLPASVNQSGTWGMGFWLGKAVITAPRSLNSVPSDKTGSVDRNSGTGLSCIQVFG